MLWEKCRTANIVKVSGCCKLKSEAMQLKEYRQQSEYCFTSLSAQSWQYLDKRNPEVRTILYSYRMTLRVLYSTQYHSDTAHSRPFNSLEHSMHNLDDTHPTRPGFKTSIHVPLIFASQLDRMSHRGRPILYCQQLAYRGEYILIKIWNMSQ